MSEFFSTLSADTIWICVGFFGQGLFFMRFFLQWLASEKAGKSVVPSTFWYFSIAGGLVLFAYALWKQDPVFSFGQSLGLLIYCRNIYFIHGKPKKNLDIAETVEV